MPKTAVRGYHSPHQFEPLLPQFALEGLVAAARPVFDRSAALRGKLHPVTLAAIRELVRSMNSYYSNRIEGQGTHPQNIDRALRADFSTKPDVAQRQRIAIAHIEAERELEQTVDVGGGREAEVLRSAFLLQCHASLYRRLAVADRTTIDGLVIEPGTLRAVPVKVGEHEAPEPDALPAFLHRMDAVYPQIRGMDALLYAIAAEHQRAAWVHPFADGNGRACRLQTHCALLSLSGGLWSVNRGLARQRDRYYALLAGADAPRQGDLDGRGNLSERRLHEWCQFFIDLCLDQVTFMTTMLDLEGVKERLGGLVAMRRASTRYPHYRAEAIIALQVVLATGPTARGDFVRIMGVPERSAQRTLSQLVKDGLLVSDGPKSTVRIGFPLDALSILFPNLYPEAATVNPDA